MEDELDLPEEFEPKEPDFDDLTIEQQDFLKGQVKKWIKKKAKPQPKPVKKPEPVQEKEPEPQTYVPPKEEKKKFFHESEIMGKYLFKDMPLFKYEIIFYLVGAMAAVALFVVELLGLVENALIRAVPILIIIPIAVWFIKFFLYMPSKKRIPSLRIYRSGVIELLVEDVSKGYITYGKGESAQKKFITRLSKHTEASTGKPFLITSETMGENIDLVNMTKTDLKSVEFNALLETNTAVVTKNVMNKMLKFTAPAMQNPMFIMLIIILMLNAIMVIKSLGFLDSFMGA